MTDYICPECGHDAEKHMYIGCIHFDTQDGANVICDCKQDKRGVYKLIIASQTQALAEAREALKPFAEVVKEYKDYPDDQRISDDMTLLVSDIRKAAEWLKKYP